MSRPPNCLLVANARLQTAAPPARTPCAIWSVDVAQGRRPRTCSGRSILWRFSGGRVGVTASDTDLALVGRDTTAALLEWLIRSRQHPLPVVVAFGPGGAGKTKLAEHVEERWRNLAPVAYVNFDDAGSKSCRDVLAKATN